MFVITEQTILCNVFIYERGTRLLVFALHVQSSREAYLQVHTFRSIFQSKTVVTIAGGDIFISQILFSKRLQLILAS